MRALFGKFGDILGVKMESKFGVVKVCVHHRADNERKTVTIQSGRRGDVCRRGQRTGCCKCNEWVCAALIFPLIFCITTHRMQCSFVSKDVIEPLGCSMQGDEEESAQASHSVMKDNILNFSRQNSKLCVAEADFERLFKSKDDMTELYLLPHLH